jgi:hypothetical protein
VRRSPSDTSEVVGKLTPCPRLYPDSLFFGKARQVITFDEAGSEPDGSHDQEVIFNHLLLNVGDTGTSKDLHDSLAEYYTPEPVEIAGKPALMREVPVAYPALLHFQLQVRPPVPLALNHMRRLCSSRRPFVHRLSQRAQFDRQTGRAYKSNAFLDLPQEIALDRYLCPADDDKAVQTNDLTRQIKVLRDRIHALQQPRVRTFCLCSSNAVSPLIVDFSLRLTVRARRSSRVSSFSTTTSLAAPTGCRRAPSTTSSGPTLSRSGRPS